MLNGDQSGVKTGISPVIIYMKREYLKCYDSCRSPKGHGFKYGSQRDVKTSTDHTIFLYQSEASMYMKEVLVSVEMTL